MHIIQSTRTKKTFCWCYTKYTRKLLSVSLKASVKGCSEPLKDRCFDFTDGFKHSELSHFTLQTKKQIIFFETVFISKLNLKMEATMYVSTSFPGSLIYGVVRWEMLGTKLGMFFLSAKDESQWPGTEHCCSTALMIPNSNFILKTIFWRSTQV